jgi:hypothetical protein
MLHRDGARAEATIPYGSASNWEKQQFLFLMNFQIPCKINSQALDVMSETSKQL